jgi:hypothetical protein
MASWQSAVVHPLGLAGYALACIFGLLAKFGPTAQYPWLAPVAVGMAVVALLGGLLIAFRQNGKPAKPKDGVATVTQTTEGDQSPAIANVTGQVSLNYGGQSPKNKKTGSVEF